MSIYFKACFTNNGAPRLAMSPLPKITILKVSDGSEVVSDVNMTEMGRGWYKYDFTSAYTVGEEYTATADGGSTIDDPERYAYG